MIPSRYCTDQRDGFHAGGEKKELGGYVDTERLKEKGSGLAGNNCASLCLCVLNSAVFVARLEGDEAVNYGGGEYEALSQDE